MNRNDAYIRFNDITISLLELRVWLGAKEIHCSLTDLRLLLIFVQDPYMSITAGELVRQTGQPDVKALYVAVCRLRRLLRQRYIVTHKQGGYSFAYISQGGQRELERN